MKIEITTPIPAVEAPSDAFVVEVDAIRDDGDFKKIVVGPFARGRDEASLESLMTTLELMFELGPVDGTDRNFYGNVEGFDHWFGKSENALSKGFRSKDSWPRDKCTPYTLSDHRVVYYNADGEMFNVKFLL